MATILKNLHEKDLEMLHTLAKSIFLDGECYAFAIALHRGIGWPIVGLIRVDVICHAGVRCPDGTLYDVRGAVSGEEFSNPFSFSSLDEIRQITEADLYTARGIIHAEAINFASKIAQALWPDLPWMMSSMQQRAKAFLDDLERISRQHGIWIRSAAPGTPPLLSQESEDEGGYVLSPTIDALTYTVDRYFRTRDKTAKEMSNS